RRGGCRVMKASVIIATYNRATLLDECLAQLAAQQFVSGDEVLVVDNGSTDRTAAVVAAHERRFPVPLRALEERRPGKSRALAAAISVAAGEILAFTDDDVKVESGWLHAIRRAMDNPAIALAGGPITPQWEGPPPRWLRL